MHLAKKHVRTAIRGQGRIKFTSPYRTYDHVVTNIRVDAWVTSFTTRKAKRTWTQRARAPTRKINNSDGWIPHNIWSVDAKYKQRDDRRVVQVLRWTYWACAESIFTPRYTNNNKAESKKEKLFHLSSSGFLVFLRWMCSYSLLILFAHLKKMLMRILQFPGT